MGLIVLNTCQKIANEGSLNEETISLPIRKHLIIAPNPMQND
jgi:hypothetical protein